MRSDIRPVGSAFVGFGAFFGAWAVITADLERALELGHGGFGLLLAVALAGSAAVNAATGPLAERWGTSVTLARSQLAWAASVVVLALAPTPWVLAPACVLTLCLGGAVDVAMNVVATVAFADEPGRLVRFHARFNAGAVLGAAAAATLVHAGLSWRLVFSGIACAAIVNGVWCGRAPLPAGDAGEVHGPLHSLRTIRAERLGAIAALFACGAMVEGGIDTWGVLVLRERLAATVLVGAGAYVVGQSVATAARATLGPLAGALGATRGLAVGGGLAAAGLSLVALAPSWGAAAGLAVAAAGISVCWPLLLAQASAGIDRPASTIGGVTAIGYLGFVVGPPVIGGLAGLVGLRPALLFLAAAALVVAVAPRRMSVMHGRTGARGAVDAGPPRAGAPPAAGEAPRGTPSQPARAPRSRPHR
jgi:MFS family permease